MRNGKTIMLPFSKWFLDRKIEMKKKRKKLGVTPRIRTPNVSLGESALIALCYLNIRYEKVVMYVNPKHEISHKALVLCCSLLSSIGPFSAPQAEYSAYTYSIQNNRFTAAVKLENTSNTTP